MNYYMTVLFRLRQSVRVNRKMKWSDSVLWQRPPHQQKKETKKQRDNTKTAPKLRLHNDFDTQLVLLNRFMGSQPSHYFTLILLSIWCRLAVNRTSWKGTIIQSDFVTIQQYKGVMVPDAISRLWYYQHSTTNGLYYVKKRIYKSNSQSDN